MCTDKKVPCPKLPPLHYGYVKVTGYYENQKATYYCKPGHILVGLPVRKCSVYGKWVGKAPVCKRKCFDQQINKIYCVSQELTVVHFQI